MKTKALGVMAAALLAGPISAQATVIYEVTVGGNVMIHYESPDFVIIDTEITSLSSPGSVCNFSGCTAFGLYPLLLNNNDSIAYSQGSFSTFRNFQDGALGNVGTYIGTGGPSDVPWTLNVTSGSAVPEPGTLALLGLGLAGLGLSRRRKVA